MRLSEFIVSNREPILAEWEAFARTCAPASRAMDITELRDHANGMLTAIAKDLDTPRAKDGREEKSTEKAPETVAGVGTAAEAHGAGRAESGFTVEQMVAELRSLRVSVIRLWTKAEGNNSPDYLDDIMRFNEAVDQSLAESVSRFTQELGHSKEMFLAILGHDLRNPLGAILMSARFMLDTKELPEPHLTLTTRIASSGARMQDMIGDLLDFTRSRLGGGIPIEPAEMSMNELVHDVVNEIAAANPDRKIHVETRGGQRGIWDRARLSQALDNLIGNALEHGGDGVVSVKAEGDDKEMRVAVNNGGAAISAEQMNGIFSPMKRRMLTGKAATPGQYGNLGLGLYIAERIVTAHRGRISVESSDESGTTFTVHLPCAAPVDAALPGRNNV